MAQLLSLRQLSAAIPRLTRSVANKAALRPVPEPRGNITSPTAFLTAIGREADKKVTAESWEGLFKLNGQELKKAGVAVRDRRYVLWCLEKYRQGMDPSEFAHPPKPKKKIRGWGPAVQNGIINRSKRRRSRN